MRDPIDLTDDAQVLAEYTDEVAWMYRPYFPQEGEDVVIDLD